MRQPRIFYLLVLASFAFPAKAQQQTQNLGTGPILRFEGVVGKIGVKPEYATLRVDVSTKASTLDEATRLNRDRATHALSALQDLRAEGIEVERSTFRVKQEDQLPAPTFRANTAFYLKTKAIDNLKTAITKLAASGLFDVFTVHFGGAQER